MLKCKCGCGKTTHGGAYIRGHGRKNSMFNTNPIRYVKSRHRWFVRDRHGVDIRWAHIVYENTQGGVPIADGYVVHHEDKNSVNDNVNNLKLLTTYEHNILHRSNDDFHGRDKVPVVLVKDCAVMEFDSLQEAANFLGMHRGTLGKWVVNKVKPQHNSKINHLKGWIVYAG